MAFPQEAISQITKTLLLVALGVIDADNPLSTNVADETTFSVVEKPVGKAMHYYKKVIKAYSLEMVDGIKYLRVPQCFYQLLKSVNLIDTKLMDDKVIVNKIIKDDKLEQKQQYGRNKRKCYSR